jgi:hypothetical protein
MHGETVKLVNRIIYPDRLDRRITPQLLQEKQNFEIIFQKFYLSIEVGFCNLLRIVPDYSHLTFHSCFFTCRLFYSRCKEVYCSKKDGNYVLVWIFYIFRSVGTYKQAYYQLIAPIFDLKCTRTCLGYSLQPSLGCFVVAKHIQHFHVTPVFLY